MLIGIYTSQRCGSNLCESLLHRHGVKPFGEQFCFKEGGGLITGKHRKTNYPVTHLSRLLNSSGSGDYSVRVMTSHFKHYSEAEAYEKMLSVGNMCDHIIILQREFFYKYTSQKVADITGQWVSYGDDKSGVTGLRGKFSSLFKRDKISDSKPVFDEKQYVRWEKTYQDRFETMNHMFPDAHNVTYRGLLESNMNINYLLPTNWNIETRIDSSVEMPIKQITSNKTGSEPWRLYENADLAQKYFNK